MALAQACSISNSIASCSSFKPLYLYRVDTKCTNRLILLIISPPNKKASVNGFHANFFLLRLDGL